MPVHGEAHACMCVHVHPGVRPCASQQMQKDACLHVAITPCPGCCQLLVCPAPLCHSNEPRISISNDLHPEMQSAACLLNHHWLRLWTTSRHLRICSWGATPCQHAWATFPNRASPMRCMLTAHGPPPLDPRYPTEEEAAEAYDCAAVLFNNVTTNCKLNFDFQMACQAMPKYSGTQGFLRISRQQVVTAEATPTPGSEADAAAPAAATAAVDAPAAAATAAAPAGADDAQAQLKRKASDSESPLAGLLEFSSFKATSSSSGELPMAEAAMASAGSFTAASTQLPAQLPTALGAPPSQAEAAAAAAAVAACGQCSLSSAAGAALLPLQTLGVFQQQQQHHHQVQVQHHQPMCCPAQHAAQLPLQVGARVQSQWKGRFFACRPCLVHTCIHAMACIGCSRLSSACRWPECIYI